jgi:hypothetical protein
MLKACRCYSLTLAEIGLTWQTAPPRQSCRHTPTILRRVKATQKPAEIGACEVIIGWQDCAT